MNDQPTEQSPIRPPVCPDCRQPMQFAASQPDQAVEVLHHVLFVCDCGRTSDQLIAGTPDLDLGEKDRP
jgi:hypothetical protein